MELANLKSLEQWRHRVGGVAEGLAPSLVGESVEVAEAEGWAVDGSSTYCPRCGASAQPSAVTGAGCPFCVGHRFAWTRLTRLGPYQSPWSEWIKALKFGGQWRWAQWMGAQLAQAVGTPIDSQRVIVCPVPLHWSRRLTRGFNQSQLIANAIATTRGWPVAPALRRTKSAVPQSRLAPAQRQTNIRNCFAVDRVDLTDWQIILVDDVKTTGATMSQCARLLRKAGAKSIYVAVVAVGDPRGMNFKTL